MSNSSRTPAIPASKTTLELRSPRGKRRPIDIDIVVKVPSSPQADLKRQYKNLLAEIEETKPKLRQLEVLQSEVIIRIHIPIYLVVTKLFLLLIFQ